MYSDVLTASNAVRIISKTPIFRHVTWITVRQFNIAQNQHALSTNYARLSGVVPQNFDIFLVANFYLTC